MTKVAEFSKNQIRQALNILFEPGDVVEIRVLNLKNGTLSSYFSELDNLAATAARYDRQASGVYVTLNPVKPSLLARAANRVRIVKGEALTSDKDILFRRWLPLDLDPVRPAGISSNNGEHEAALERTLSVRSFLKDQGWPEGILADSGNGGHLLYRINLPNDEASRLLVEKCLKALAFLYTDESVTLDVKVGNAARIWKVYGTFACKGDNIPDRPHRRATFLDVPEKLEEVSREQLVQLATMLHEEPKSEPKTQKDLRKSFHRDSLPLDIEAWIQGKGLSVSKIKPWDEGTIYELEECPWDSNHKRKAKIIQFRSGALSASCFHNSCAGKNWHSLRDLLEPGWRERTNKKRPTNDTELEKVSLSLSLKEQIEEIRKKKSLKIFQIKRQVSSLIILDMRERGLFYKTLLEECYWFENETKTLSSIGSEALGVIINEQYGINQSEVEYKFLLQDLITEAMRRGMITEVRQFAYFSKEVPSLYVYNNKGQMYKLDGKQSQLVDNGTDGVLFLKNLFLEPFEYVNIDNPAFLQPLVRNPINFVDGTHVNLNKKEQEFLFALWLSSLFFESLQPTKPIFVLLGPKGSGKTTAMRLILKMLFGKQSDVTSLTKEDDFDAAVTANSLICFDNVDGSIDWLNDRLAHTATGKMIQKRELYTTNKNICFFPKCFLSLNAREPKFKRDDVVDRLLLFRVERLESFRSEEEILENILSHRNELWSELLNHLNFIVAALAQDKEPFTSKYRMADWAKLSWRIAKSYGQGDRFKELLEKMDKEQSSFLLEEDPLYLCLVSWFEKKGNQERKVTAGELFKEFQTIAEEEKIHFSFKSVKVLGKHLQHILSNLKEFFTVQAEKNKQDRKWYYTFTEKR
jgi:hypothetical protein